MTGCITALLVLLATAVHAQDVTGSWQGTLASGAQTSRLILQLSREGDGHLTASLFNLEQGGFSSPAVAFSASLDGSVLRASFGPGDFEGRIGVKGATITGTWTAANTQGATPSTITFAKPTTANEWRDSAAHRARFVRVERDVQLEVLDFGGTGRPVVLLAGLGSNAHVFDTFAPKLTDRYHVYAITRRGFAPSSVPASGYLADSLADDVVAVLDSLQLTRPVLMGHSLAGEELSSIGTRRAQRVAGLVYLDAGYPYALYDPAVENRATYIIPDVQRRLALIFDRSSPISPAERIAMIRELTDTTLPVLTRDLRLMANDLARAPNQSARPTGVRRDPVSSAIFAGSQRYSRIQGPVLAFFVATSQLPPGAPTDPIVRARYDSISLGNRAPQIAAFERGVPQARVVRLLSANHFVWRTHEDDVFREIRSFVDSLATTP